MFKALVQAARLRTLPLAIASIATGAIVAAHLGNHNLRITVLAILTAVWLQILSNFANDYGDFTKGVDAEREDRALGSGSLSVSVIKNAMLVAGGLSLLFGITLLYQAFGNISLQFLLYFIIGLACIGAAIWYTAGKNPYGYSGFGDLAVFIFFGLIPVCGIYYLNNPFIERNFWLSLLPGSAFGLLSTGVLNINNIRDIDNDKSKNKITLAVMLGNKTAVFYQLILILTAFVCLSIFYTKTEGHVSLTLFLILPLFILHWFKLKGLESKPDQRIAYNKLLKQMVLLSVFTVLIFGLLLLL
ncbi:MAG: 1,4-dihydroxy-2-naphthoate octaprenyltransferase [Bacteroidetes bacterium]|nr:1,4-dihydroxy-2-naphthoate octaprenyltransferase [Bacteroidota bacterium]